MGYFLKSGEYQPTMYDVLMRQKTLESALYYRHLGYGMYLFTHKSAGNRQMYLVNSRTRTVYDVMDASGNFNLLRTSDIDIESASVLPGADVVRGLCAPYDFTIGAFHADGTAEVTWVTDPATHTTLHGRINSDGEVVERFAPTPSSSEGRGGVFWVEGLGGDLKPNSGVAEAE